MNTVIAIILVAIIALYIFYRIRLRAGKIEEVEEDVEVVRIEKVKPATYIICPNCGTHLEVDDNK